MVPNYPIGRCLRELVIKAVQICIGTIAVPPGAMTIYSTVGAGPAVVVTVFGREVLGVVITQRVTCYKPAYEIHQWENQLIQTTGARISALF